MRSRPQESAAARSEAAYWARMGDVWERWESAHLYGLSSVDPYLFRESGVRPGERVLDIGCGIGEPALSFAAYVAPKGSVVGIDVSPSMIEVARRRARSLARRNASFRVADVQRFRWRGRPFDVAISRYALMFAEDLEAALANVHASLGRGGRLAVAVWGRERDNAGFRVRVEAARPFARPGELESALPKRGLSPLRFADPSELLRSLRRVGLRGVRAEYVRLHSVHQSPEGFARFTVETSMRDLYEELKPADRRRLTARLETAVAPYTTRGAVRLPGAAWVVRARRP